MKIKLVHLHGIKTHMGCEVKHGDAQKWAPLCQPNVWQSAGLFKGGIQVIDPFDGEISEIDCKRCLAKMGRGESCPPKELPAGSDVEKRLAACRKRLLVVDRSLDALTRERSQLVALDQELTTEKKKTREP